MSTLLYFIFGIIGLFIIMQLSMRFLAALKKGKKLTGIKGTLGQDINSGRKLLVYFYSNSCAACRPMSPIIDKLKQEFKYIHKINVPKDMDTARIFGIMATPTTVIVENGKIRNFVLGAKNYTYLQNLMQ